MKKLNSVLLLADQADPRALAHQERVQAWLEQRGVGVERACPQQDLRGATGDLAVVVGGDGTFLRAARSLEPLDVPVIGVRFGSFGYLAELEPEGWEADLERLLAGEGRIERWMRLRCRRSSAGGKPKLLGRALNEVVVTAANVARLLEINVRIDGVDVTRFRGDGMIVATPVGSTAHSLAAGGPIIEPNDRSLLLTPLTSQALTFRSLVLRPGRRVELGVQAARHGAAVTLDGQQTLELRDGDVVEVGASRRDLRACTVVLRSRFQTLRERLQWGEPLVKGR